MGLADHITCRVVGVDDVLRAIDPRSEAGARLLRAPTFFAPSDEAAWRSRRSLQEQVEQWWTTACETVGPALEQLPTLDRPLRILSAHETLDDMAFFELKRFLFHAHRAIHDAGELDLVDASWSRTLSHLMHEIHPEQAPSPRFRLSARLDERLAEARKELKQLRKREQQLREQLEADITEQYGGTFDVRGRFVASTEVEDDRLKPLAEGRYELVTEDLLAAATAVTDAQDRVAAVEATVRQKLSAMLAPHTAEIEAIRDALARMDLLSTLAELRQEWRGAWPRWADTTSIAGGLHPWLHELKEDAQPISVELGDRASIVTGPNMGGKSMLLKLIGLCSWCAQHGLPVPAASMSFRPIARLTYVGADADDTDRAGLSAFGREVRRIVEQTSDEHTLWLLDELCRGTHPEEGAAIAREFVELRVDAGDQVVAATHFPTLAHWDGADHFQIAGLTNPETLQALGSLELHEIEVRLRAAMDYTPVRRTATESSVPRDARRVARALGLELSADDGES